MSHSTLKDINRRELTFRDRRIEEILPDFFPETYPKLFSLFEKYYEFVLENNESTELLDHLFQTRDITTLDSRLLVFLEDELLLGQSYFEGFTDKRSAAKFSNTLYRSKGTKYSIQQFFRMFFGIDPEIRYPKEDIFTLGSSKLGPADGKFITNDELYQTFSILIKTGLPISKWKEIYKLFVHPSGFYLGAEIALTGEGFFGQQTQILIDNNTFQITPAAGLQQMPDPGLQDVPIPIYEGFVDVNMMNATTFTANNSYSEWDSAYTGSRWTSIGGGVRLDPQKTSIRRFGEATLFQLDKFNPSLLKMVDGYVIGSTTDPNYGGVASGHTGADSDWQVYYPDFSQDSTNYGEAGGGRLDFSVDSGITGLFPSKKSFYDFSDN